MNDASFQQLVEREDTYVREGSRYRRLTSGDNGLAIYVHDGDKYVLMVPATGRPSDGPKPATPNFLEDSSDPITPPVRRTSVPLPTTPLEDSDDKVVVEEKRENYTVDDLANIAAHGVEDTVNGACSCVGWWAKYILAPTFLLSLTGALIGQFGLIGGVVGIVVSVLILKALWK